MGPVVEKLRTLFSCKPAVPPTVSIFAENIPVKQIFTQFFTSISARSKKSDFSRKYEPVSLPD